MVQRCRIPDELLWITDPKTGEREQVVPGEVRKRHVIVGGHIPQQKICRISLPASPKPTTRGVLSKLRNLCCTGWYLSASARRCRNRVSFLP